MEKIQGWLFSSEQIDLADCDVHIWQIALEQTIQKAKESAWVLSDNERQRAECFHFERHRRRFLVSHIALRQILARYTGMEPKHIQYQFTHYGKPHLSKDAQSNIEFNLSHSYERAMVAISKRQPVGVDIEYIRPTDDIASLAKRYFSPKEYQQFTELPKEKMLLGFFNAWTRKESYIKAIGEGLSCSLETFDVSLKPGEPAQLLSIANDPQKASSWTLRDVKAEVGYVAAFAVQLSNVNLHQWIYQTN